MKRRPVSDAWMIAGLVAVLGLAYGLTLRPGQDWGGDFAQYISHARNIASGRPYLESRYEVTLPDAANHMPRAYPPVFPLLLAPVYHSFGLNYMALKILVQALFVLSAVFYYVLGRLRGLDAFPSAAAAAACALSGLVLSFKDLVLSDSAHLLFAGLTLCALRWIVQRGWDNSRPVSSGAVVAILMLLAYGSRAVGATLAVSFVLYEVLVKRRIRWFGVVTLAVSAAGIAAMSMTVFDGRTYQSQFSPTLAAILSNVVFYFRSPATLWMGSPAPLRYALFAVTLVIALAAYARRVITQVSHDEFYVAAVIGITLVFSASGQSSRYLLPIFPLYFIYFFEGLRFGAPAQRGRITAAACALLALGALFNLRGMEKGPYAQGVEQPTFTELCTFVRQSVGADASIISWNPRVMALYTDRRSVWYPQSADDAELARYLERVAATHILVYSGNPEDERELEPFLARQPGRFVSIFRNADFTLYRAGP